MIFIVLLIGSCTAQRFIQFPVREIVIRPAAAGANAAVFAFAAFSRQKLRRKATIIGKGILYIIVKVIKRVNNRNTFGITITFIFFRCRNLEKGGIPTFVDFPPYG